MARSDLAMTTTSESRTCPEHGEYSCLVRTAFGRSFPSPCPQCAGAQAAEASAYEQRQRALAESRREALVLQQHTEAGITVRHALATFETFRTDSQPEAAALARARQLVDRVRQDPCGAPSMILVGNPGTGKTHLACAMIRELVPLRTVRRRKLVQIIRDLRASWSDRTAMSEGQALALYGGLDLLIVEEVGVGSGTDAELNQFFEVMDARYENRLATVLISNFDIEAIKRELGDRIVDRLREDNPSVVALTGASRRPGAAHE